ncbi:MAG TPA: calcium-binding protein [Steroidobacteraceae bacterium]|nr:calcium-binding protein [Steroidobacteraceae bacterium]
MTKRRIEALIAEAIVDACTEPEQRTAFYTLLDDRLDTPFVTKILGVAVSVERVEFTKEEQIVAICRRARSRQAVPILELPLPALAAGQTPPRRGT